MINKLSKRLATSLIGNNNIEENERGLYEYGIFLFLTMLLFFVVDIIVGLLFGVITESLIFMLTFLVVRQFAGGYHAKTELRCEIFSSITIILSVITIKLASVFGFEKNLFITAIAFGLLIIIFSPVDSENKKLTPKEKNVFKKISILITLVLIAILSTTFYFKQSKLTTPIAVGICLEGILLMIAVITNKLKKSVKVKKGCD